MRGNRFDHVPCPIARTADLLGDPWTLMILRECTYGATRFDDFQRGLSIAPNTLSARLDRMVENGLLEREQYNDRPPRFAYRPTEMGRGAFLVLAAMIRFGDDFIFEDGRPPIVLRDLETGEPLQPLVIDERTGEPLSAKRMRPTPGPGFPKKGSTPDY